MATDIGIGSPFPPVRGHTLEGKEVKIPASSFGRVTLVVLVFARAAQGQVDSWIHPFERELCHERGFMYYEVPMIASTWGRMFSGVIDAGMRAGTDPAVHPHVVTYYGDYGMYASILALEDPSMCYPFLLDKRGIVRWRSEGQAGHGPLEELISLARMLQAE